MKRHFPFHDLEGPLYVAAHEAGHVIIAQHFGFFAAGFICFDPAGISQWYGRAKIDDGNGELWHRRMLAVAGMAAEHCIAADHAPQAQLHSYVLDDANWSDGDFENFRFNCFLQDEQTAVVDSAERVKALLTGELWEAFCGETRKLALAALACRDAITQAKW